MEAPFAVGDKAVYPAHGVAEVVGLETREIGGKELRFYILRILENNMTVMIPTHNVNSVGLRCVMSKKEVKEVFTILKTREISVVEDQTWNRRYREYTDKLKTGDVIEIAEVLRDLSLIRGTKELSFGERKMLENAQQLLVKELAIAKDVAEAKIEDELDKIFEPVEKASA